MGARTKNDAPNTAGREMVITRIVDAPRELVWEAMTNPKHVVNWWGPDGFTNTLEKMDFRVGGVWKHIMHTKTFRQIQPGMTKSQVLRILGLSDHSGTSYYKARDELVWEWRYCDEWNEAARFDVLFDGSKEVVRSTQSQTESQMGLCGYEGICTCAHAK